MGKARQGLKYIQVLGPLNFLDYCVQRWLIKRNIIEVKMPGLKEKIFLRNNSSDIAIFTDVFINKEHEAEIKGMINCVIDCGANIGLASLYFLKKFPAAKIIAVEPEAGNFLMLKKNLENYPNAIAVNMGVWNKETNLRIVNMEQGNHSFKVEETNDTNNVVRAISIGELIQKNSITNVDLLKIDIEGSEEQVFENIEPWIKNVNVIFLEIHEKIKPGITKKIIEKLQPDFNFSHNSDHYIFTKKDLNQGLA